MTSSATQAILDDLATKSYMVFATLHNVRLVDVTADADGNELLHVLGEGGEHAVLPGFGKVSDYRKSDIGKIGTVGRSAHSRPSEAKACYFRPYLDQTLRRTPALDFNEESEDGRRPNVIGWRCDEKPRGFRAPSGLTPGEAGAFVEDQSESVTLRVPAEFVWECKRYGMSPAEMLQGFACDAAGVMNYNVRPRADGFSSNGSDERDMADEWMHRAYAGRMVDVDALEAEEERQEEERADRDEVGYMLDEWISAGGDKDTLIATIERLLTAKLAADDINFNPTKEACADAVAELEPTADEAAGMAWWNALSEVERYTWLDVAKSFVVADAWEAFKRAQGGKA